MERESARERGKEKSLVDNYEVKGAQTAIGPSQSPSRSLETARHEGGGQERVRARERERERERERRERERERTLLGTLVP
jgi:hypothetical protein